MADYFSHDYGARNDPKLVKLQMELGHEGKGLFWDLIEILYEQGGYIENTELNGIAFGLHTNYERITKVLSEYDLFKTDGQAWWSESVMKRLNIRADKSEKARESVLKRWEKYKRNTDVKQTNNKCNTIKERKGKEIKEKDIIDDFENFWNLYDKKVGEKTKIKIKWLKISNDDRAKIFEYIPKYKISQPDKQYRKNPETFLNNKSWNDEIIARVTDKPKPMAEIITNDKFKILKENQRNGRTN